MREKRILCCFRFLFLLVCMLSAKQTFADHLKGGWIKYTYLGSVGSSANYSVSFYQYSDCSEPEKVDPYIYLSIYDAVTNSRIKTLTVSRTSLNKELKSNFGPCFQSPPTVCYLIAEYTTTITLPANANGYVLTSQRCCRIDGIANVPNSHTTGLTYTVTIPGGNYNNDSSPEFDLSDTVAICYNSPFSFDFSAKDADNDSLVYMLCDGLTGGAYDDPNQYQPKVPLPPPYESIPYSEPYSGLKPLGENVVIDSKTGILSGTAPTQTGTYVVAVCVDEYRNGVYIAHTRKEIHLDVADCKLGGAQLDPSYITCDGFSFNFQNKATVNSSYSYFWDFGIDSLATDTSSQQSPTYIYPDTGTYTVKLKANNNKGCQDSATTEVKIFPGFNTDFSVDESCIINPYGFKDLTTTKYGVVNSWKWYFDAPFPGEPRFVYDTVPNPFYTYADTGLKTITLITTNSKGCIDSATKTIDVTNGPNLSLKFLDTLICNIDTLQLQSFSTTQGAVFNWSPAYNIISPTSSQPLVYPQQTTTYGVNVNYKGCVTSDSVTVNVIDHVDLSLPLDTTICKTDSIQLTPTTNALYFSWSPAASVDSSTIEYPHTEPLSNTNYTLRASVGKCFAVDAMNVNVVPYPAVAVSDDASICFGSTTQLSATIDGSYFTWSPSNTLVHANTLTPLAGPQETTTYTLLVTDTLGCPKPVYDTVTVKVIPKVIAFAGNDTAVVRSQPLQLHASGATNYQWFPASGLSNANIADPVVTFSDGPDTISYNVKVSTPEGCFSDDSIKIYIFETQPEVFIPTAFTPNGDGKNDVFRPTVAGMKQFMYLRIYNRWGQLLFNSGRADQGWDGTLNGTKQESGTYVYTIQAIDYNNKPYFKRGTFVLIR